MPYQQGFQSPKKPVEKKRVMKANSYQSFEKRRGPTARGKALQKYSAPVY